VMDARIRHAVTGPARTSCADVAPRPSGARPLRPAAFAASSPERTPASRLRPQRRGAR
jgi:hypothetical protein